ncbi:MAG: hypothetical protein MI739_01240 [Bacteroidales bacterium]|nr:hypothetical protein [Bacteroidales bacterium]
MSKFKSILLILLVFIFYNCDNLDISSEQADTFMKLFGANNVDIGKDVKVFDNGYLIAATIIAQDSMHKDIGVIKTDKFGNQEKVLRVGDGGNDEAAKLLVINSENFLLLGTCYDTVNTNKNIYLGKYNSDLELQWEKLIGNTSDDEGISLAKANSGYIIVGNTNRANAVNNNPQGVNDIFLIKVDDAGNVEWENSFGGAGIDIAGDVINIGNGYVIVGTTNSFNEPGQAANNIIVIETNLAGNENDKFTYGSANNDEGTSIVRSNEDGYVITGSIENIAGGNVDVYVAKLGQDIHNVIWTKAYGTTGTRDFASDIIKTNDALVLVGNQNTGTVERTYFVKIDFDGEILKEKSYGGYDAQLLYSIERSGDGGFVIVGSSGFEGNEQICLLKVDADGEF